MSVWLDKTERRPDGQLCDRNFENFAEDLLCLRAASGRWCTIFRTVSRPLRVIHIKALRVRTRRMVVRTVDEMHTISISDARTSRPCWLASRRLDLNCDTFLMDERVHMGFHVVRTVAAIFSYLCLERNPEAWSNTESHPDGLLNRADGWKLEQFEASRHRGRSGRKSTSFGRMML
jgi:hypothetical protein